MSCKTAFLLLLSSACLTVCVDGQSGGGSTASIEGSWTVLGTASNCGPSGVGNSQNSTVTTIVRQGANVFAFKDFERTGIKAIQGNFSLAYAPYTSSLITGVGVGTYKWQYRQPETKTATGFAIDMTLTLAGSDTLQSDLKVQAGYDPNGVVVGDRRILDGLPVGSDYPPPCIVHQTLRRVGSSGLSAGGAANDSGVCSSLEDCLQTGGYDSTVALAGGVLALLSAFAGFQLAGLSDISLGGLTADTDTQNVPDSYAPLPSSPAPESQTTIRAMSSGEEVTLDRIPSNLSVEKQELYEELDRYVNEPPNALEVAQTLQTGVNEIGDEVGDKPGAVAIDLVDTAERIANIPVAQQMMANLQTEANQGPLPQGIQLAGLTPSTDTQNVPVSYAPPPSPPGGSDQVAQPSQPDDFTISQSEPTPSVLAPGPGGDSQVGPISLQLPQNDPIFSGSPLPVNTLTPQEVQPTEASDFSVDSSDYGGED